jgi:hypothetical protein
MQLRERTDNFDIDSDEATAQAPKPNTLTVVALLLVAAATFSYLGAYAATNALANAGLIRPISHDHDPRMRWALTCFVLLMSLFGLIALVSRIVGRRQVRRIDRMNDGDGAVE